MRCDAMNTRLPAALLVSALLAGCASYTPSPIHPEKTAQALTRRTLSDPRLLRFLACFLASLFQPFNFLDSTIGNDAFGGQVLIQGPNDIFHGLFNGLQIVNSLLQLLDRD